MYTKVPFVVPSRQCHFPLMSQTTLSQMPTQPQTQPLINESRKTFKEIVELGVSSGLKKAVGEIIVQFDKSLNFTNEQEDKDLIEEIKKEFDFIKSLQKRRREMVSDTLEHIRSMVQSQLKEYSKTEKEELREIAKVNLDSEFFKYKSKIRQRIIRVGRSRSLNKLANMVASEVNLTHD